MSDAPGMDPARWRRAQELFHEALERPQAERDSHVETACAGDPALADLVRAMLREDADRKSVV